MKLFSAIVSLTARGAYAYGNHVGDRTAFRLRLEKIWTTERRRLLEGALQ